MRKLTRSEVSARLFAAADALRGTTGEPLELLAGLVLLKRAHDQPGLLRTPSRDSWASLARSESPDVGARVTQALRELESMNSELLQGALMFADGTRLNDAAVRAAIGCLDEISFSDEALEFADTLAKPFDAYLGRYAERHIKGGESSYTPPPVAELMVRLVEPKQGHSVYDPFVGTGGMLIHAFEYVQESNDNAAELGLFGQDRDGGACAQAQLNLLLHGITDAEIRHVDPLVAPAFLSEEWEPRRFDRVLCNPPFSGKYDRGSVHYQERMKYGWASPAHADLMNIQHVIASLRPCGRGAVIAPHGVLFRSGADAEIRRNIIESGRLAAVIGIGANVFYGTSVPACVLVLDGEERGRRPERDSVLFINAEDEIVSGRTKNRLEPQNIEMIVGAFRERADLPGFSRIVPLDEIAANDHILSIRRYVNTRTPEPSLPDVTAVLSGGIPKSEVQADFGRFRAYGIEVEDLFLEKDAQYYDFPAQGWQLTADRIPEFAAARRDELLQQCSMWWESTAPRLAELKAGGRLLAERKLLTADFVSSLDQVGVLHPYRLAGVFAACWSRRKDDLRGPGFPLDALAEELRNALIRQVAVELQQLIMHYRRWGERYGTSLADLDAQCAAGATALKQRLNDLGFAWP